MIKHVVRPFVIVLAVGSVFRFELLGAGTQSLLAQAVQSPPTQDQPARLDQMLRECSELLRRGQFQALGLRADEALKLSRELGGKERIARALNFVGLAHFHQGRLAEALEAFRQVIPLAAESGNKSFQMLMLNSTATLLRTAGQFEESLYFYTQALALSRELNDPAGQSRALRNIGTVYTELGDFDEAERSLQSALQAAREAKNIQSEREALSHLGQLERKRGRYAAALAYYEQASKLTVGGITRSGQLELLNNIAAVCLDLGDYKRGEELFRQALPLAREIGSGYVEAQVTFNIGVALHALGQLSEALQWQLRGVKLARQFDAFLEDGPSLYRGLARLQRDLGDIESALESYRQAIKATESLRSRAAPSEVSRASFIAARRDTFVETIELLVKLNRTAEALEIAERYRARAFLDLLAESRIDIRQELSAQHREQEVELFGRISALQKEQWKESLAAERRRQLEDELKAAEDDLERFRLEMHRLIPRYGSVQYTAILTAERIQQMLDAETLLLEYILGEKQSFVWAVSRHGITIAALPPRREIEERVTSYRETLSRKVSALTFARAFSLFDRQSREMYRWLVQPVEASLTSVQKLIIVTDGVLAYLPFETLIGGAGAPNGLRDLEIKSSSGWQFLLERFAITYAPSASALAAIQSNSSAPVVYPKTLLAVGDPLFEPEPKHQSQTNRTQETGRKDLLAARLKAYTERGFDFVRLPYTRREVESISALYPASQRRAYLGTDAREEKIKAEKLGEFRHIHFATHGISDEQTPGRSGIVLTLDDQSKEDGLLQVREIMQLKLNADLVVLSACSSGLGKLVNGEGLIGLTRAFFYAGARSVVVSLWNVNDLATAELMKTFYQHLKRGLPKDEALRQAKLAMIRSQQRTWRHPYFWAPFVLVGERTVRPSV